MRSESWGQALFIRQKRFIQEVTCLDDVLDILEAVPTSERDLPHEVLLKACNNAAVGQFPLSAVRRNFQVFAKKKDMLVEADDLNRSVRGRPLAA
jgi:hypothetical protein